jgi:hypothetical protein
LHLHDAEHDTLHGIYILDIRYAFADVDGFVGKAAVELARHFPTRHVHVLENENNDAVLEHFLGISMAAIPSFPTVHVVAPCGVFSYMGSVSSPAARAVAIENIRIALPAKPTRPAKPAK